MFYGYNSMKGRDGAMWRVAAQRLGAVVVETIKDSKILRGSVLPCDAKAYTEGKMPSVRVYGVKEVW